MLVRSILLYKYWSVLVYANVYVRVQHHTLWTLLRLSVVKVEAALRALSTGLSPLVCLGRTSTGQSPAGSRSSSVAPTRTGARARASSHTRSPSPARAGGAVLSELPMATPAPASGSSCEQEPPSRPAHPFVLFIDRVKDRHVGLIPISSFFSCLF